MEKMQQKKCKTYYQLEKAFARIAEERQGISSITDLARASELEPVKFQKRFKEWAGVGPKIFFRSVSLQIQKGGNGRSPDLFEAAKEIDPAGSGSRFDDMFSVTMREPGDLGGDREKTCITYSIQLTRFGKMMVATTDKGICRVSFLSEDSEGRDILSSEFPKAEIIDSEKQEHIQLANYICTDRLCDGDSSKINLHLNGTEFQISVWEALLQIPEGILSCCADIAKEIGNPKAVRAVGSAVGSNPVAYFIPCHRVIPAAGGFGNYRWGKARKVAMIGWEAQGGANSSYLSPR